MWLATNSGPFELNELSLTGLGFEAKILHIADIHFAPGQRKKADFLRDLASTNPDLVANTGDNLGHKNAINPLLTALEPLLDFPGVFVNGSNDYYAPKLKNPARYLFAPSKLDEQPQQLDTQRMISEFVGAGWLDLNNKIGAVEIATGTIRVAGTEDAHIDRARLDHISNQPQLALTHAPYTKVLDGLAASGAKLILAGHTHGGQLCLPRQKAIVTNCDLPTKYASGLSDWHGSKLYVSAGIGCSIYAPLRIFCPPSATLITVS